MRQPIKQFVPKPRVGMASGGLGQSAQNTMTQLPGIQSSHGLSGSRLGTHTGSTKALQAQYQHQPGSAQNTSGKG